MKASVTIDPRVQSKGSSWLRTLTGSMLGGMAITDEVFIIRDSRNRVLELQKQVAEQQREIVSNERDWNLIAQELHCENTREEMLKSVRERDLTIQGFREAAQEALVVIAALLNAVDWELSPAVIEALRGADEKLMTALAGASSAKEGGIE